MVYMRDSPFPYIVVRSGYGVYRQDVRIRRWDEPDRFESGLWMHYSQLLLLEINDTAAPGKDITVATEDGFVIAAGTRCRFRGFDKHGDAQLYTPSSNILRIVFDQDSIHFNIG